MELLHVGSVQGLDMLGRLVKSQFVTTTTKSVTNLEFADFKNFGQRI